MYSLFSVPSRVLAGQLVVSRFKDVSTRIREDVEKVIQYHRIGTSFVATDHLLLRMLFSLNIPLTYDLDHYYSVAVQRALPVANSLNLTTAINPGKLFNGEFYYGCDEIILAYSDEDRPDELIKNWRELEPVKVLQHPVSNMRYLLPDGMKANTERGLAVIGINVSELAVMWRGFMLAELVHERDVPEAPKLGIRNFLGKYVIPNMLRSQTDLAIINRLINLYTGEPMGDYLVAPKFHISDYTRLLDTGLLEVLDRLKGAKMRYRDMLAQIPSIYRDFPLKMPDIAETRQVYWALYLARLKEIGFLLAIGGQEAIQFNGPLINELKTDLKRFKADRTFEAMLPDAMCREVSYAIKDIQLLV